VCINLLVLIELRERESVCINLLVLIEREREGERECVYQPAGSH
jgi:hypothetical protein